MIPETNRLEITCPSGVLDEMVVDVVWTNHVTGNRISNKTSVPRYP